MSDSRRKTRENMGYLKYLRNVFLSPNDEQKAFHRERLLEWRRQPVTVRVDRPTRLDRARALGYRAKPGVIVVRQRVQRGSHKREQIKSGRKSKRSHHAKNLAKNYQQIAEEKSARKYRNCEVLGSYLAARDGKHSWYETILVERRHPAVLADNRLIGIAAQRGRAARGLTSAGRKSRGLRKKGIGSER